MGGDNAPREIVRGAARASLAGGPLDILLVGDLDVIGGELSRIRHDASRIRLCHVAPGPSTDPHGLPSHVRTIAELVAAGEGDAAVSASDKMAWLEATARFWRPLPGVTRPALAAVFPTELRRGRMNDPFALVLDVNARADATAAELVQFAKMGVVYASLISRNEAPRVALLAASNHPPLGPVEVADADVAMRKASNINYVGALEGTQIPRGVADVIVSAGHLGNVVLSMLEAAGETVMQLAEYSHRAKVTSRLSALALTTALQSLRPFTEWHQYAGAPLLGYHDLLLRVHPRAGANAFANAIRVAAIATSRGLLPALARATGDGA